MQEEIKHIHKDLEEIRQRLSLIQHILSEERELSSWAKKELKKARKAPKTDYISHEELKRRILK